MYQKGENPGDPRLFLLNGLSLKPHLLPALNWYVCYCLKPVSFLK